MDRLITNLYSKYAPEKDIETQIAYVKETYGSNISAFISDFYAKYAPDRLNEETINHINENYLQQEQQPLDVNVNAVDVDEPAWRKELRESSNNISSALSNFFPDLEVAYQSVIASTADAIKPIFKDTKIDGQTLDDLILEKYERIAELQKQRKDTGEGIVKGVKEGDVSDIVGGVANVISSIGATYLPAMLTRGQSIMPQIMAPMITEYNQEKARSLYGDDPDAIKKLIENDEVEIVQPGVVGFAAGLMERFGIKGIQKYINQNLTVGRGAATLLMASGREGATELGQFAAETTNRKLAQGADIAEAAWEGFASINSEEGAEAFAQGLVGGKIFAGGGRLINRALRNDTDGQRFFARSIRELADRNMKRSIAKKGSAEQQALDIEIKAIEDNLRTYLLDNKKVGELLNNEQKTELQNLIIEKDKIRSTLKGLKSDFDKGNITQQSYGGRVRAVTQRYSEINNKISEIKNTVDLAQYETQKKAVEEGAKIAGKKVQEVSKIEKNKILKEEGYKGQELTSLTDDVAGIYNPKNKTLFLDKETALEVGEINVAGHELLHPVFNSLIGNREAQGKIVEDFKKQLTKEELDFMEQDMINRNISQSQYNTEYINVFSDNITKNNITFNENIFSKIGDVIIGLFRNVGFKNISFDSGRGVYNFLKEYHKGLDTGKFSQDVLTILKKTKGMKDKIAGTQFSQAASDNVQRIYEQQGVDGSFEIIQQFKPIVNKLVEKRSQAPNFDRDLLTGEIELGQRGILDLIKEYNPESGVPLAAYINKFLPARAIEASRRVLGEEFTTDITEARGVAVEEVATPEVTTKPRARKINPIDLVTDPSVKQKYIDDVINKLQDLDPAKLTFKKLKDLSADNTAKIFDVPVKKVTDPTANLTKQEKENALIFIRSNALDLISLLPKGAITEAASEKLLGTSTGVPKSLLNNFYTKQERITKGAGLSPYTKNRNISKADFLKAFGIVEGKKSTDFGPRTPEAQAVKAMMSLYGKLATNSIVRDQLRKQGELKSVIEDIAAGKSELQFSKAIRRQFDLKLKGRLKIDTLLTENGLDKSLDFKEEIKTPEGRQKIVDTFKDNVVTLLPKEAWFGPRGGNVFTTSGKDYGISMSTGTNAQKQSLVDLRDAINNMLNDPNTKFGAPIKGVSNYTLSSYGTIFKGSTQEIKSKSKQFNKKISLIHEALWKRINAKISQDKSSAPSIATYLKLVANHTGHWHKLGAQIEGYSPVLKGSKYEYEHAMPATAAYLYLLDAALTRGRQFAKSYKLVMDNYKLIALDNADNKKLGLAKLARTMPDNWDIIDNKWWERYFNEVVAQFDGGIDPSTIIDLDGKSFTDRFNINARGNKTNLAIEQLKSKIKTKYPAVLQFSKTRGNDKILNDLNDYDTALRNARNLNAPVKGISIFDFDDTLATTKSKIIVNMPDGKVKKITPAEFAKQHGKLEEQGATFDFNEFNKVVRGKPALAANKLKKAIEKFGNKDVFVLTARPQASAQAIYEFLKGIGLEIPLKNITGLENGTPQAKANWVVSKAAEGYNDFYFTDDVYKNVKAVQDALEVLDVKSKSRIAYTDRVAKLDKDFNDIIEAKTGIASEKEYSIAKAKAVGSSKGKFTFFIPPSAEDFVGLLYPTLAKGKLGDNQMAWYKKNLLDPFARANANISRERIALMNDYNALKKQLKIVPKNLRKNIEGEPYTNEQAVRVYIWNKQGMAIPGLSKTDLKELTDYIESKPDLKIFGDQLISIQKGDEYNKPNSGWLAGSITTDIQAGLGGTKRAKHLAEWQQNADIIFSEKNLNKMEAAFGKAHRAALEGVLKRMKTGVNRSFQTDNLTGKFTDWLTNSIGTIMFFNTRSALLQTISAVNFINFKDNNIFAASKAYANQPQFWSDFMKLMNSDFLVDRRRGLRINVNEADIANMARESGVRGAISKLLEIGFLPTQIADSFAIASGGATFYRNRIKTYEKQGLSKTEAEAKAMDDFREIAEESQQSSRPDRISAQQAGPLGRIILAFGNTPMQYARLIKKAASDLKNRRGDWKTNTSKIIYYGVVQNLIFNALQQAIFAIAFGESDEDKEEEKYFSIANGMADSLLRGVGIAGAFVSVGKNAIIRIINESEKPNPKYEKIGYELTRISPPISSKLSKLNQAARSLQWEKDEMLQKGLSYDNPAWLAGANVISATTNIPLDRLVKKTTNVVDATGQDVEMWERLALLGGWSKWELDMTDDRKKKKNKKNTITLY